MSRLPRSGGATAAGWGCLPSLFGGCGVAGSAFSPKAELQRSTAGGSGCSLVALGLDRSGRWGWVGLDRLHGLRLVAWLVCWPGLAAGGVAGWGCCGSGGGLPAPLLLRRSCSPAGLPLCLYGRGLLRAAVWPCSCWPAAWRCRLRWAGWALGWHDPAGLVGWGQAVPVRHTAQFFTLYFVTFHPSLSG